MPLKNGRARSSERLVCAEAVCVCVCVCLTSDEAGDRHELEHNHDR
jgi:hypothetical protein